MMSMNRAKMFSAAMGGCALLAALALNFTHPEQANAKGIGGSGDSSTTNVYTPPSLTPMSFNPTTMSLGSTATAAAPASTLATALASPVVKATAAPGCMTNNGVECP
jgi:hypothetical protein